MGERIVYIYSKKLVEQCNKLPTMKNRASIIQDLINSFQILTLNPKLIVIESQDATEDELKSFHSSSYIDFLKKVNDKNENNIENFDEEQLEYGLGYDCPILENIFDFAKTIAGGSVTAAKLLTAKICSIAIHWFGGWHHAQRDSAEGFCYVNDIVIAIQILSRTYNRILYLDLDIHHGNGVQNAFEYSNKILTLSFHKFGPGFYPGTGSLEDNGMSKGKYYSINVPLLEGINDKSYLEIFNKVFSIVLARFKPNMFVVQCGADGLNGDPIGQSNLTLDGLGECVKKILDCNLPTLFLGGGGYNFPNTARLWVYLTSIILKQELDEDIPDSCEYFTEYGPSFELKIDPGFQKDLNSETYINSLVETIDKYTSFIE